MKEILHFARNMKEMTQFEENVNEICNLKHFNPIGIKIFKYVYSVDEIIKTNNYSLAKLIFESTFGKPGNIYIYFEDGIDMLLDAINTNNNDLIYLAISYFNDYQIYKNIDDILNCLIRNNNIIACKTIISQYNISFYNYGELNNGEEDDSYHYNQIKSGFTSLYCAVKSGNFKFVKYLLKLGANPNIWSDTASDNEGKLPLHAAIESNNYKMAKLLVLNGAEPDNTFVSFYDEPIKHFSPLHYALRDYKIKFIKLFQHYCKSLTNEEYLSLKTESKNPKKEILEYTQCQFDLLNKYD